MKTLKDISKKVNLSTSHLSRLAKTGVFKAQRVAGVWIVENESEAIQSINARLLRGEYKRV